MAFVNFLKSTHGLPYNVDSMLVKNSAVLTEGEFVRANTNLDTAGAGNRILGNVDAFTITKNGTFYASLDDFIAAGGAFTGNGAAWNSSTRTFTAGSDNATTDKVMALVNTDTANSYFLIPTSAALTAGTDDGIGYMDLEAGSQTVNIATYAATTASQIFTLGAYNNGTVNLNLIVGRIAESQLFV